MVTGVRADAACRSRTPGSTRLSGSVAAALLDAALLVVGRRAAASAMLDSVGLRCLLEVCCPVTVVPPVPVPRPVTDPVPLTVTPVPAG